MMDQLDLEMAQGRFDDKEDERRYQQWLDSLYDEQEMDKQLDRALGVGDAF